MRLAIIKNRYIYDKNDLNGVHHYGIYYDRKAKEYRAVQLTHLYNRDEKRFVQLRKGFLSPIKLKEFETPTGIRNEYYATDVDGNKIDIHNNDVKILRKLSPRQSKQIKDFGSSRRFENGKYKIVNRHGFKNIKKW